MCLKNLATNTLIPTGVATTARTRGSLTTGQGSHAGGRMGDNRDTGSAVLLDGWQRLEEQSTANVPGVRWRSASLAITAVAAARHLRQLPPPLQPMTYA
jgi:hypothetical protein